jgi:hypothetical protein
LKKKSGAFVRDERAKDPLITVSGLEKALENHFQRGFSHQYVSKIADKVARESLIDADRTQANASTSPARTREELPKIVYWSPDTAPEGSSKPRAPDRIEAAKNVVMMDLALLSAEIANGMYKKPIDAIANAASVQHELHNNDLILRD